ncbi:MAG: BamA/TamA family outer membrane protein [Phycisphaeraceae bacterium]|nr:BamA/TamA family outer membrane protein [Phycisphaeraceae bacterium]
MIRAIGFVKSRKTVYRPHHVKTRSGQLLQICAVLPLLVCCAIGSSASAQSQPDAKPSRPVGAPPTDGPLQRDEPKPGTPDVHLEVFQGRPVREIQLVKPVRPKQDGEAVTFEPVDEETAKIVRNQLRLREGAAYDQEVVSADITRLNRLGRFKQVETRVQPYDDGSVALIYILQLQPIVQDVQSVGNRKFSDQQINKEVDILRGTPVDPLQLERASRRIEALYRKKGFYLARVSVDEEQLEKSGIVIFNIREGERLKVVGIRFEGNRSFGPNEIQPVIKTKTAWLFNRGPLDDDVLDDDVGSIIRFYKDRGFLDVRVDREVRPAPTGKEAIVTFLIDEGPVYTLRSVETFYMEYSRSFQTIAEAQADMKPGEKMLVLGPESRPGEASRNVFVSHDGQISSDQAKGLMLIKPGDVYSVDKLDKSIKALANAFGMMGYVDAQVTRRERRDTTLPQVDIVIFITQGNEYKTGEIIIQGNDITQQKVARRQIELQPDRPLDTVALENSTRRLKQINTFDNQRVRITAQKAEETDPEHRDVLVEVAETNTGEFNVGAAISSDGGVLGRISITQRNFDIADTPDTAGELFSGRAFRGGGQTFNITALPGDQVQSYGISLAEPYLFETDFAGSAAFAYNQRTYDQYSEQRVGPRFAISRRFGTRWLATVPLSFEKAVIYDIPPSSAVDIYESQGSSNIYRAGLVLSRSTFDDPVQPTRGSKIELGADQVYGTYNFNVFRVEHQMFIPLQEDYLGRTTTLSFHTRVGYIPQGRSAVPVNDRFYLGGSDLRGFDFRTVSPRTVAFDTGLPSDQPIGGTWMFSFNPEIKVPIYDEILAMVFFVDTGTVLFDPGFDDYRVSVGTGLRINIPQLSGAPLAFDFGFPIVKQPTDSTRLFTFSVDVPF